MMERIKLVSIDIGIKNFSFAVINVDKDFFCVQYFHNQALFQENMKNFYFSQKFFLDFYKFLNASMLPFLQEAKYVLIEKQLWSKKNYKCSVLYHHLMAYILLSCGTSIQTVPFSPSKKYKVFNLLGKMTYSQRKKWAVDKVKAIFETDQDEISMFLFNEEKKKDDIADSILMGYIYYHSDLKEKLIKGKFS